MTYCENDDCKYSTKLYNGDFLCLCKDIPVLRKVSGHMNSKILYCSTFEKGPKENKDIRQSNGLYPGQMGEIK